eukprot:CAMPEP_0177660852 /NCGR_PEP_ID=MMETSP0447-20121125/18301_1 /TAXON_ID=0 /ORGANISM="Stygamoeba regulata, Strain BSH-02190019" /LENGTH=259 /DNA_ID=CAMNT_0019166025 /DNA_START=13 /DNA_END=793 /DNA_ORIENTATION=+
MSAEEETKMAEMAENKDTDKAENMDEGGKGEEEGDADELEQMKKKVQEMAEEAERLEQIQKQVEEQMSPGGAKPKNGEDVDSRSIYVGNVDYAATPEEVQSHFQSCGTINRVTILCDKFSGHPKGFAYVEFADEESVSNALVLNETIFRGRPLKVSPKRTNVPGFSTTNDARGGVISWVVDVGVVDLVVVVGTTAAAVASPRVAVSDGVGTTPMQCARSLHNTHRPPAAAPAWALQHALIGFISLWLSSWTLHSFMLAI